jgi:hypothetical protein
MEVWKTDFEPKHQAGTRARNAAKWPVQPIGARLGRHMGARVSGVTRRELPELRSCSLAAPLKAGGERGR